MNNNGSLKGLTERELLGLIPGRNDKYAHVIRGIGDDCAVVGFNLKNDTYILLTQDSIISGRHFVYHSDDPYFVGWKALARSLSDIAAMGGDPQSALVAYGIPPDTPVAWLKRVFEGLYDCGKKYSCPIIGGDMASTAGEMFFSTTCMGTVTKQAIAFRTGTSNGDMLCVTGTLGGSIAGKHLRFEPRIDEAKWLIANSHVSSMIDLSDGIAKDLSHIAEAGNIGFRIDYESVPLSQILKSQFGYDTDTAVYHALYDGEDYELLFTVSDTEANVRALCESFSVRFGIPCTVIGRCDSGIETMELWKNGRRDKNIEPGGFEHFV